MNDRSDRSPAVGSGLSGVRVLVVEDDPAHTEAIRRAFERADAELDAVRTLAELRAVSASDPPQLALIDLNLPDGRALEVLTSPPEEGAFPVLVMTSFGNEQIAVEAMKAGALDYVVKSPEAFAAMPHTVERAFAQWRILQEKREAERRSQQLTRVYLLLSEINQAIVRIRDLEILFPEACRIAVETGGFQAAWIGLAGPGARKILTCHQIGLGNLGDESPGAASTTFETGRPSICNDVRSDPAGAPWREMAEHRNFLAWAALPLRVRDDLVGAFCLYSSEAGLFDENEVALLTELALDLSFAVETSRREVARAQAEAEIERLNASLEAKVRERTAALEAANRDLESFSYSVSHDLRAPLRAIDGFSQLLAEEHAGNLDEDGLHLLQRIRSGAQRMGRLVDDLLALSRLGRVDLSQAALDLGQIASEVVAELRAASPERAVEFVQAGDLGTTADASLARILLHNLLENAWKFTSRCRAARVELGVEDGSGERVFFVRDNGAGFELAQAGQLFQPFQRLHRSDEFEGTGIGLAIVRRIVQRHGGHVSIKGETGRGATVRFTLAAADRGPGSEPGP